MKFIAYAGFRTDNGALVEAFLHECGKSPRVRLCTLDRVRVQGSNLFELELSGKTHQECEREIADILMKALIALDPQALHGVRETLKNPPANMTRQSIGYGRWVESELIWALAVALRFANNEARGALEVVIPGLKLL